MKISVTLKGILIIQSYPLLELFLVHMMKKNLTQNEFWVKNTDLKLIAWEILVILIFWQLFFNLKHLVLGSFPQVFF